MVVSLHDLLERIRPAGTPGPGAEGEVQRREAERLAEVSGIIAVLHEFEAEASALIATAESAAAATVERARLEARQTSAGVADRVARAEAEVTATGERQTSRRERELRSSVESQTAELVARADDRIPALVGRALQRIWAAVDDRTEQPS